MSSAYSKFYVTVADLGNGVHDLNSNQLNMVLCNTAPIATNAVLSDLTQIAGGNGYTTGGTAIGSTAYSQTLGVATLSGSNVVWTATGAVGPLRYAAWYNYTAAGKNLGGSWDYGSGVTLASGETFTVNLTSNILTLT